MELVLGELSELQEQALLVQLGVCFVVPVLRPWVSFWGVKGNGNTWWNVYREEGSLRLANQLNGFVLFQLFLKGRNVYLAEKLKKCKEGVRSLFVSCGSESVIALVGTSPPQQSSTLCVGCHEELWAFIIFFLLSGVQ